MEKLELKLDTNLLAWGQIAVVGLPQIFLILKAKHGFGCL